MKNFGIIFTVIVLTLSLCACGRRDNMPTEAKPSPTAPTAAATIPTIDPTMGTNIPDPEVDSSMPDMMDPSENAQMPTDEAGTGNQNGNGSTNGIGNQNSGTNGTGGQ